MNKTYEEAVLEIQEIIHLLQEGNLTMTQLTNKVREATELITLCKEQLRKTESNLSDLFNQMDSL